jgi:hypothetical protein
MALAPATLVIWTRLAGGKANYMEDLPQFRLTVSPRVAEAMVSSRARVRTSSLSIRLAICFPRFGRHVQT